LTRIIFSLLDNIHYAFLAFFVFLSSYLNYINYLSFSPNWDLGDFVQVFWYTIHGRPFIETATPFFSVSFPSTFQTSFLAIHFSPIIIVAAPFYAIYPAPLTLFVIGSIILAIGGLPVYWFSVEKTGNRFISLGLLISYLAHPAIFLSSLHGFVPELFLAPLGIFSFYFLLKRKIISFMISSLLLCLVIEEAGFIVLTFIVIWLISFRKSFQTKEIASLIFLLILVMSYISFAFYSRVAFFGLDEKGITSMISRNNWSLLGASSTLEVPFRLFSCPDCSLNAFAYDIQHKLSWLVLMLAPTLFMNFFFPVSLLGLVPWTFVSFLSNYPGYYSLYSFEDLFAISTIHLGSVIGLTKALSKARKPISFKKLGAFIIVFVLSLAILAGIGLQRYGYDFKITNRDNIKERIISLIPGNASVLAETDTFPHLANRFEAYRIPSVAIHSFYSEIDKMMLNSLRPEYVLLDLRSQIGEISDQTKTILSLLILNSSVYSVYAYSDGIILFRMGQRQPLFINLELKLNSTNLISNMPVVSKEGRDAIFKPYGIKTNSFWFGPYSYMPPGNYTATFVMQINSTQNYNSPVITLDAVYGLGSGILASKTIYSNEVNGSIQFFTLNFSLKSAVYDFEIRGMYPDTNSSMYLYSINIMKS
jgi:uncharacterized membrane protein